MPDSTLHFVIRTPQNIVLDSDVVSIRVPTETGQVGLRPRSEPTVLAVEPGLIVVRLSDSSRYAGTAGGLLHCDGKSANLLTPVAVVGDELTAVLEELDRNLSAPNAEQEVRAMLKRLEKNILEELQHSSGDPLRSTGTTR
jgi:F0F1-type ATP synthase epsilon subunit